jgi:acyl-coenzyme A synthetase/AMP-(fatty) acid ligase
LVEYISQELAPHKRPRHVYYVSTLPHAATGKLDRAALAGMAGALRPLISRGDAPA